MKTKDSIFGLWMSDLGKSMRKSSPVRKPLKATCINVVIFTQFSADKEHLSLLKSHAKANYACIESHVCITVTKVTCVND